MYIEDRAEKCYFNPNDGRVRIDYRPKNPGDKRITPTACADLCTSNGRCKFFYYNSVDYCELYDSCDDTKNAKYIGTVYRKGI